MQSSETPVRDAGEVLFHISEEPDIARFEPRASQYADGLILWAIEERRLCNYLVPRDCPRVTYYAGADTTAADKERFLGSSPAVVAIESAWLERLRLARLYCYHMPPETFECLDACAGYFVSQVPIVPSAVSVFDDLLGELLRRGTELRVLPNLWPLRDAVVASSLQFSMIRMRNAAPREPAECAR
jgi:Family of unknown function (DUF6886)